MTRTRPRLSRTTPTGHPDPAHRADPTRARTRHRAGAGLLLAGALLTGCGAQPGEIPLSEIRAESPTPAPTSTVDPAVGDAAPGAVDPAAVPGTPAAPTARNGLIAGRVFLDQERLTSAIFAVSADGRSRRQLTQPADRTRDDHPAWSPDGTLLAFDRADSESPGRIWTTGADGGNARQLGALCETGAPDCLNEAETAPSWSPDGRQLAFTRTWGSVDPTTEQIQYSDLYVIAPDGTTAQRVTFLTNDTPYSGAVTDPAWSPDGKQLVFSYRTSATGQPANASALYVVNADGTGMRRLTPWELRAGERANWSPDGSRIVFTTYPTGPDNAPGGGIYTVHPDGTTVEALTPGPSDTSYGTASYSPDGTSIAFAQAPAGGNSELFTMHADGSAVARVTDTPGHWEGRPTWGTAQPPS
ncbi:TolB family protein [Kitasatospora sp. NPDC056327]|uniref:TolB family protein n=1 Tax=Kitasatospora sp. NPDC056327 TaxID=3345785 RepID=UPI0035E0CDF9